MLGNPRFILVVGVLMAAGCASTPNTNVQEQEVQAVRSVDEPSAPPVAAVMPVVAPAEPTPEGKAKSEGVPALAKRLEKNRLTQYWREKNTYTYFVGTEIEAEYKPGQALTLRDDSQENGLTCTFALGGGLDVAGGTAEAAAANKDRCNQMMFTLDQQLGM